MRSSISWRRVITLESCSYSGSGGCGLGCGGDCWDRFKDGAGVVVVWNRTVAMQRQLVPAEFTQH